MHDEEFRVRGSSPSARVRRRVGLEHTNTQSQGFLDRGDLLGLLVVFGAVAIVRSFLVPGTPIGGFAWKAIILVIGGTLLFGFLIRTAGLPIAMVVLVLLSAAASAKFAFEWRATAGLVALVVFCALVFVKGLGVPMPLLGSRSPTWATACWGCFWAPRSECCRA